MLRSELKENSHIKSKVIIFLYRSAQYTLTFPKVLKIFSVFYCFMYRFIVDWVLGVDIPVKAKIGRGLILYHSVGLVVNENAVIGRNCILRQGVTIGNKIINGVETSSPIIGDNVEFGAGSCVLGPVSIGDNCIIGANAVVTKSFEPDSIIAGVPASLIKTIL